MFQSVRPNSQIYIFYKGDNPRLEIGYNTNSVLPKPKYPVPPTFGQPQEMVVDLVVKVNGKTINCNGLSANADIADTFCDGENIVVSDSKEAMNAEILSLKQKSVDIINSIDFHKALVNNCDKILSDLNPEFAEKQQQRQELDILKTQMKEMASSINDLMEANRQLIEQLNNKEK